MNEAAARIRLKEFLKFLERYVQDLLPFEYASLLHRRSTIRGREPTREEISLLLYLFSEWGWRSKRRT
jgi:hypothetical protein